MTSPKGYCPHGFEFLSECYSCASKLEKTVTDIDLAGEIKGSTEVYVTAPKRQPTSLEFYNLANRFLDELREIKEQLARISS